ncbi:MAG: TonB-dependent siderophore receptor [Pseudomonadota bacterium]
MSSDRRVHVRTGLSLLALSTALGVFPAIASAATTDAVPAAPTTINTNGNSDIVVVGRVLYANQVNAVKTPTPIIDVPQSLTIISADQIIEQGFTSIGEIVQYTPGVTTSQGEGHRDAVVFRGVRSTADFYLDGVRDDVQYFRSLYNLQQVEILRGPNALLFGRGGTGGILNRVTKKGVLGESFVAYKTSVNTFGAADIQLDANFDVADNAALRVNAYYEYLNNHRDFYDGNRFGINPTLKLRLTPNTSVDLSYEYINNERFVDRGIPAGNDNLPAEQLVDITFGDPDLNTTTFESHIIRALIDHRFSDRLKGNFSIFYGDYDKLYGNLFPVGFDDDTNIVTLDGYVDKTQRQNFLISANLVGEFETGALGHMVLVGGEFIDTVNNNDRFNTFFDTAAADGRRTDQEKFLATRPINIVNGVGTIADGRTTINSFTTDLNDDTEADITVFSAYLQDQIEVVPWLDLVLGVRFDSFDITVNNIETLIETDQEDIRTRTDSRFSPRLGAVIKPRENISIYASYSESFLPRSGEQFADINPPDDALDPNTFTNLEVGIKWDPVDNLSLTASIFEVEQSSPQISDDNPDTLDIIDSQVRGFEAQLIGQLTNAWFVSAGYSYLDGNQVDSLGVEGNRLRELPEHSFSLWNRYQVTSRFGLGAGLTFQDDSFAGNNNTTVLPSFVRVDAAAYYEINDSLRLQVNLENLTDTAYFPNAHTNDNITVGAPLNARFTISGQF